MHTVLIERNIQGHSDAGEIVNGKIRGSVYLHEFLHFSHICDRDTEIHGNVFLTTKSATLHVKNEK